MYWIHVLKKKKKEGKWEVEGERRGERKYGYPVRTLSMDPVCFILAIQFKKRKITYVWNNTIKHVRTMIFQHFTCLWLHRAIRQLCQIWDI